MHPLHQHINELVHLNDEEFAYVLEHFTPLRKRKYQYLVQEGEPTRREYWVVKGCLKSSYLDEKGKEHVLSFSMENWWVTDYKAFIHQTTAEVNVDCLEDCELLAITYENREKLTNEMHKMERFWAKKTKFGYAALQGRILSLLRDSAAERYDLLLNTYPQLAQRVSKKLIASYLGVTRETLSRLGS
ncbi:MAG: Crp/Fnr family transcriptional regulator [Bacteroidota bacterium]